MPYYSLQRSLITCTIPITIHSTQGNFLFARIRLATFYHRTTMCEVLLIDQSSKQPLDSSKRLTVGPFLSKLPGEDLGAGSLIPGEWCTRNSFPFIIISQTIECLFISFNCKHSLVVFVWVSLQCVYIFVYAFMLTRTSVLVGI